MNGGDWTNTAVLVVGPAVIGGIAWAARAILTALRRQDTKLDALDRTLAVKDAVDGERSRAVDGRIGRVETGLASLTGEVRSEVKTLHGRIDKIAGQP